MEAITTEREHKMSAKNIEVKGNVEIIGADVSTVAGVMGDKAVETIATPAGTSKAKVAKAIFQQMFAMEPVPARKDMIARAQREADLTPQGAATYLQNYKRDHGLSKPRTAVKA